MKKRIVYPLYILLMFGLVSCQRSSGNIWEDTKTVSRHLQRRTQMIWGKKDESRAVDSRDHFSGPVEEDFIPLQDEDLQKNAQAGGSLQPKDITKVRGAPTIEQFQDPQNELASIFKRVHFNTDDHNLRKKEYFETITQIAQHLRENPKTYVFVIGHCDQRASEAYNLALGARRANMVRSLLIKKGVSPNRIYTISLGKEMPLDPNNNQSAWFKNRRVEFKVYSSGQTL